MSISFLETLSGIARKLLVLLLTWQIVERKPKWLHSLHVDDW